VDDEMLEDYETQEEKDNYIQECVQEDFDNIGFDIIDPVPGEWK